MAEVFMELKIATLIYQLPYNPDKEIHELGIEILKFFLKRWEDVAIKDNIKE